MTKTITGRFNMGVLSEFEEAIRKLRSEGYTDEDIKKAVAMLLNREGKTKPKE
jgi:hypothetical protein